MGFYFYTLINRKVVMVRKGTTMICNSEYLYRHWHDYFRISVHVDDPRYYGGRDYTYHEGKLSGAIKRLYQIIREETNFEAVIEYVY